MVRQVNVVYAMGCVFEEDKRVVLSPGMMSQWVTQEFTVEKELEYLSQGLEECFPKESLEQALVDLPKIEEAWGKKHDYLTPFIMHVFYDDTEEDVEGAVDELNSRLKSFNYYEGEGYTIRGINCLLGQLGNVDFDKTFNLYCGMAYAFEKSEKVIYYPVSLMGNVCGKESLEGTLNELSFNIDVDNCCNNGNNLDEKIKAVEEKINEKHSEAFRIILTAIDSETEEPLVDIINYCNEKLGASKYLEQGYEFVSGDEV